MNESTNKLIKRHTKTKLTPYIDDEFIAWNSQNEQKCSVANELTKKHLKTKLTICIED